MRKLIPLLILLMLLTHLGVCAQRDQIRYGGTAAIAGMGPSYVSKSYRIRLLANLDSNGTFPLIAPNSTFNEVLFNGTHVKPTLERNSPLIAVGDRTTAFVLPFLITVRDKSIDEVGLATESINIGSLEIFEARRGGMAKVKLGNESLNGSWVEGMRGWLFRRSWERQGELSYLLIFDNGTYVAFQGISRVGSDRITLENVVTPYDRIEISVRDSLVTLKAYGPSIRATKSSSIRLERGLLVYEGNVRSLLEIMEMGETSYAVLSSESCSACELNGNKFYFDKDFRISIKSEVPGEVIGGTRFLVSLDPPDGSKVTSLIFETTLIILENVNIPVRTELEAPVVDQERNATLFITTETENGIFGQRKEIRILPAYGIALANSTKVYLLGGKGSLIVKVRNSGSNVAKINNVRIDLLSDNTSIRLFFPTSDQLPPRSSVSVILPLNVPIGRYLGKIYLNITDAANKTYTLVSPGHVEIYSLTESPINILPFVSPESPNLGDDVRLTLRLSSAVPIRRLLINVSSPNMDPTSDTSKLLANLSESETVRLEFSFKTKALGSSYILISVYYLPEGYQTYRATFKEVPISVGEVSGRVLVEAKKTRVAVNESVEVTIKVEGPRGEVTLEFPRGVFIVESQGTISGNKLKLIVPSQSRAVLRFSSSGNFSVPSLALLNGTRFLPIDTAHIYVIGGVESEKEREVVSKLAGLNRRYRTLVETLRGSASYQDHLERIEDLLNRSRALIDEGRYSDAEGILRNAEDLIVRIEERTYARIEDLFNFLMYFSIGGGFTLLLLILRRFKKRNGLKQMG